MAMAPTEFVTGKLAVWIGKHRVLLAVMVVPCVSVLFGASYKLTEVTLNKLAAMSANVQQLDTADAVKNETIKSMGEAVKSLDGRLVNTDAAVTAAGTSVNARLTGVETRLSTLQTTMQTSISETNKDIKDLTKSLKDSHLTMAAPQAGPEYDGRGD